MKTETFTLRISPEDRELLSKLSSIINRSQSDTVRWVVRNTLKAYENEGFVVRPPLKVPEEKRR